MRDYYAEFLARKNFSTYSESELTLLTKAPINTQNDPFGCFVSSFSNELEKNIDLNQRVAEDDERDIIIRAVQFYLQTGECEISEDDAIDAYTAKLELVRSDPGLIKVFDDLCEERKSILLIDGRMTDAEAEAFISNIQFGTTALMMT